jgi:hypothetical integral membrane protein (TIGR02206 family)
MTLFSLKHLMWMTASLLFGVACILFARVPPESRLHKIFCRSLFWIVLVNEIAWSLFRHFYLHVPLRENLPLHQSDLTFFNLLLGVATKKRIFCDVAYFVGIPGAFLGILLPHIEETGMFLNASIARYYLTHGAMFGVGFYLTFGIKYYPPFLSVFKTFAVILVFWLLLIPINQFLGTNYFYVMHPAHSAPRFFHEIPLSAYRAGFLAFLLSAMGVLRIPFWFLDAPAKSQCAKLA